MIVLTEQERQELYNDLKQISDADIGVKGWLEYWLKRLDKNERTTH